MNDRSLNNELLRTTVRYNFSLIESTASLKWDELFSRMPDDKLVLEYEKANRNFEKWVAGEQGKSDFLLAEMARRFYIKSTGNTSIGVTS